MISRFRFVSSLFLNKILRICGRHLERLLQGARMTGSPKSCPTACGGVFPLRPYFLRRLRANNWALGPWERTFLRNCGTLLTEDFELRTPHWSGQNLPPLCQQLRILCPNSSFFPPTEIRMPFDSLHLYLLPLLSD